MRLFLNNELRVAGNARAELGRQRNRLVETVGVQTLGATKYRRHGLDGGSDDVVVGVLFGERPARGLAVRAEHEAFGIGRAKPLHDAAPEQTSRAHLRDLKVEVHAHRPKERQARGKVVDIQPLGDGCFHVFRAICEGESHFQGLVSACLLHVITRDGDRVKTRHVRGRMRDDVADDAHAGLGRVNVGVAHHELFQNVILNRPRQLILWDALLFSGDYVTSQNWQHRTVHGHGDADLIERNAVEQNLHVLNAVDRHARLANVTCDTGVVAVVSPMGRQVERHAHALATSCQGFTVKRIRFGCGRETCVLANGPRTHRVHGGLWTPNKRREAG